MRDGNPLLRLSMCKQLLKTCALVLTVVEEMETNVGIIFIEIIQYLYNYITSNINNLPSNHTC